MIQQLQTQQLLGIIEAKAHRFVRSGLLVFAPASDEFSDREQAKVHGEYSPSGMTYRLFLVHPFVKKITRPPLPSNHDLQRRPLRQNANTSR